MGQNGILENLSCVTNEHVQVRINQPITMSLVNQLQQRHPEWMVVWRSVSKPAGGEEWLDLRRRGS